MITGWISRNGWSAATHADANELYELAQRLIELGAPPASRTAHRYTSLHRAAHRGDSAQAVRLAGTGVDPLDAAGATPLVLAVRGRHEATAAALLDAGADPDHTERGWSVLGEAAHQDAIRGGGHHLFREMNAERLGTFGGH